MTPIDFAHKKRLAEADKEQDARLVTVKDVLLEMIEDIDKGIIDPKMCVISFSNIELDQAGWRIAGMNKYETIGLLSETQHHLIKSE